MEMVHKSVMLAEVLDFLRVSPGGVYIDATLGGGGHSLEIAKRLGDGLLVGVDQDDFAINRALAALSGFGCAVRVVKTNFSKIEYIMDSANISHADGVLMDLGVSSFQLDDGSRGFSYMSDGALDMRMNRDDSKTAYDVVNGYSVGELKSIFLNYGEERWGGRIAQFIVDARAKEPINTSFQLVSVIKAAIPKAARRDGPHPAKRVFQAIRIEVNNELGILEDAIENYVNILAPNGRICIITFHSLEDRIVKNTFRRLQNPCICPREMPICTCGKIPMVEIVTKKPVVPSDGELHENPRARSAKLRVAQKIEREAV
ncbi:MAG: 16S rRNA (cytosine(1402)-N(4))-methyltransferase RsmH [Defluviitaleaceae bacterium]|nr:16S rRNA (cytosine(1402)-N(4))-methyltransferase RsmH [Defluviitaleaceae bacterium]